MNRNRSKEIKFAIPSIGNIQSRFSDDGTDLLTFLRLLEFNPYGISEEKKESYTSTPLVKYQSLEDQNPKTLKEAMN